MHRRIEATDGLCHPVVRWGDTVLRKVCSMPMLPSGYGEEVDMWAPGMLTYDMLTGDAPIR